jgi:hypothetical protein
MNRNGAPAASGHHRGLAAEQFGDIVEPLHHTFAEQRLLPRRRFEGERLLGEMELR